MEQMRGIYAIPPTPFKDNGELDEQGLRSIIQFCLNAGAHGIVTPVNASEFISLTDDERKQVVRIAVDTVSGQIPVVAGVAGTCEEHAVYHAHHAREAGADSLIAMPPYVKKATPDEIVHYYQALDREAQGLPVWIQNNMPPVGTPMSPQLLARIVKSTESVHYVKEECWPAGHYMTELLELAGDTVKGIQGGMAGRYLLDEYARGACGSMPACEICDVHVRLWELLEAGDQRGARDVFNRMLPLLNLEFMYGVAVYKEVLVRRGIISSAYMRNAGHFPLDDYDRKELSAILEDLQPLFRV
ncbi:dihydrodipicolinate synthase family protein [Paenibacillus cremeus]|uniref:Dihydrodipicolinate synthase family protein n=1 Tax=Paenibacillus cremeus TaxID=2163881 RepID=A0A559K5Y0_9BACL|nr:dihydrodipicolinate synthase family protein [Paenibacillus cremeus]TVY07507.1 dihydrodipicolinate synthase family protein [Paenibacillus cremeus]